MLVDTNNLVPAEQFQRELGKYIADLRRGSGPLAITKDAQVVGVFISKDEYEALHGAAVKALLAERSQGPTVSHEEVRKHARNVISHSLARHSSGA